MISRNHAQWLREQLTAERVRRGWSLEQTARAIARELGRGQTLTKQSFQLWEKDRTKLRLEQFDAWARAMGLRLEVAIAPRDDETTLVRVPRDADGLAAAVGSLKPADRELVDPLVRRLLP